MVHEIIASADLMSLVAAMLICGAVMGIIVERHWSAAKRSRPQLQHGWRQRRPSAAGNPGLPWQRGNTPQPQTKLVDAAEQLRIVMGAVFSVQPLLNEKEARVYRELDRAVMTLNPEWRVMAQVSLGEVLRSKQAEAYSCINSKRIDLLIVDDKCGPRHAIEYQGPGHYQGTAAARDAVKKEALRRAGIGYHEIIAGRTTPSELKRLVERLVEKPATAGANSRIEAGKMMRIPSIDFSGGDASRATE